MGALKGSASFLRFFVDGEPPDNAAKRFEESIGSRRFLPLHADAETLEQAGWVAIEAPFDDEIPVTRDMFMFGHLIAVTYREDKYAIPRPMLARAVKAKLEEIEREQAQQKKEKKEMSRAFIRAVEQAVLIDLKRKSFPRSRLVDIIWDTTRREVRIFGRGSIVTERIASLFERTFQLKLDLASYAARAYQLDMPTRARGVLDNLSPAWLFPDGFGGPANVLRDDDQNESMEEAA